MNSSRSAIYQRCPSSGMERPACGLSLVLARPAGACAPHASRSLSPSPSGMAVAVAVSEVMWSVSAALPPYGLRLREREREGGERPRLARPRLAASSDLTLTWPSARRVHARVSPLLLRPLAVQREGGREGISPSRRFLVVPPFPLGTLMILWPFAAVYKYPCACAPHM